MNEHIAGLEALGAEIHIEAGYIKAKATRLRGAFAIRLCFINWRTTAADVEEVVALMASIGKNLHTWLD